MTEQAPDRIWSGIDIPKTIAAALAAVCAAVIGSFLGVAGTLVGAAVASVIGSVGTEIYTRSLKKGRQKLETLAPPFIKAPAAVGTPPVAAASEEDTPSHIVPEPARRQIRWRRVWVIAGVLFVLAMGTLTLAELMTGKSVASTVGNSTSARTTVGGLLNPGRGNDQTPTPAPTPSVTPTGDTSTSTDSGTATTSPTTQPASQAPFGNGSATTEPTTPSTTRAPEQSPPPAGHQDNTNLDSGRDQNTP
jgi:hypothetical protein